MLIGLAEVLVYGWVYGKSISMVSNNLCIKSAIL